MERRLTETKHLGLVFLVDLHPELIVQCEPALRVNIFPQLDFYKEICIYEFLTMLCMVFYHPMRILTKSVSCWVCACFFLIFE